MQRGSKMVPITSRPEPIISVRRLWRNTQKSPNWTFQPIIEWSTFARLAELSLNLVLSLLVVVLFDKFWASLSLRYICQSIVKNWSIFGLDLTLLSNPIHKSRRVFVYLKGPPQAYTFYNADFKKHQNLELISMIYTFWKNIILQLSIVKDGSIL